MMEALDILLVALIFYIIALTIAFKFKLKWLILATSVLWFIPIFLIENIFITVFSVIMIVVTYLLSFFNEGEDGSF